MKEVLTPKEKEVIELVVKGLSNKEIAGLLSMQETTVKIHLYHIFNKMGLKSRTQLIAHYYTMMRQ